MSLELAGVGLGANTNTNTSLGPRPGLLGEVPPGVAPGVGGGRAPVGNVKGTAQPKVAHVPPHGAVQHFLLAEMVPQTHTALGNSCKWSHH